MGIVRYAHEAGWILEFAFRGAESLQGWRGDGILSQVHPTSEEYLDALKSLRVPRVDLAGLIADDNVAAVIPDYRTAGRLVAEHFLERGFTNFACLAKMNDPRTSVVAKEGLEERLKSERMTVKTIDIMAMRDANAGDRAYQLHYPGDHLTPHMVSRLAQEIQTMPRPLAVMCHGTILAHDIFTTCKELGLLVPEDVSIASFLPGEYLYDEAGAIPFTRIMSDYESQGYEAARLLDQLMQGAPIPKEPVLIPPIGIVVRQSSDTYAAGSIEVSRALVYIMRNFHRPNLYAPDVAAAANVSVRGLYRLFERHVGRSISEEINRVRYEKAKRLLVDTDQAIKTIAETCGYGTPLRFRRSFHKASGLNPTQYRRRVPLCS